MRLSLLAALSASAIAQNVTVPTYCTYGYEAGTSVSLLTLPYTYDQVLSVIGDFQNLTWSGNPPDTVTLNGTDNTIGTARSYITLGAHLIETLGTYSKPAYPGPYVEVHTAATFTVSSINLTVYIPYDGTVVTPVCNGAATMMNMTAHFCANNATLGTAALYQAHLNDEMMARTMLGGMNFTSCAALAATGAGGMNATTTTGSQPAVYTGVGAALFAPSAVVVVMGLFAALMV